MSGRFSILDDIDKALAEDDSHWLDGVMAAGQPGPSGQPVCQNCGHAEHGLKCSPELGYAPSAADIDYYFRSAHSYWPCACPTSFEKHDGFAPEPETKMALKDYGRVFIDEHFVGRLAAPIRFEPIIDEVTRWGDSFRAASIRMAGHMHEMSVSFTEVSERVRAIQDLIYGDPLPLPQAKPIRKPREYPDALQAALDARRGRNTGPVRPSAQTAHRPRRHP